MKIRTNAGEVELTAAMVCRGMVFQSPEGAPYTLLRQIVEFGDWVGSDGSSEPTEYLLNETWRRFLGCNPEIASRADCERFGVHGDAAAHGFARLRDGGAVDLRRAENVRGGMVLWSPEWFGDGRVTLDSASGTGEAGTWWNVRPCGGVVPTTAHRFIGLNADHASPEDVKRLCCGDQPTTWAEPPLEPGETRYIKQPRCTLAIGDHEQHEDLATGVKWATSSGPAIAKANIRARLDSAKGHFFTGSPDSIRRVLAACDLRADVHRLVPGSYRVTLEGADAVLCDAVGRWLSDNCPAHVRYEVVSMAAKPARCDACGCHGDCPWRTHAKVDPCSLQCGTCGCRWCGPRKVIASPKPKKGAPPTVRATWTGVAGLQAPPSKFVFHDGDPPRIVVSIQGNAYHCECGAETPSDHAGTCKAPFWIREASLATWCEWRRTGDVAAAGKACHEARIGASVVAFVAGLKRWAASAEGKRAAQERALVALVSAVPEGLNPIGWRAAVLACHESYARLKNYAPHPEEWGVLAAVRGCPTGREGTWKRAAEDAAAAAYHRAITPAAPVPRVRATWKTRGPVLAVDDGRDE